jgi:translation initiation factor 2B subunit (eIF-2B alpha/beta/delta family)
MIKNQTDGYPARLREEWDAVQHDTTRGATELLRVALTSLHDYLRESGDGAKQKEIIEKLGGLRPDMVGFANASRMLEKYESAGLVAVTEKLLAYLRTVPDRIAAHAERLVERPSTVLVNSRSSVVAQTLLRLHESKKLRRVLQSESRPACEGHYNAERLLEQDIPVTVFPDAAMGHWVRRADIIMVGADAIAPDGSFLGKIGCSPLAVLAWDRGIPFYVVAEKMKLVDNLPNIEDANRATSGDLFGWGYSHEKLHLSNVIFEHTPAVYVSYFITEDGTETPPLSFKEILSF